MVATGNSSMAYHFDITCAYFGQQFVKIMTEYILRETSYLNNHYVYSERKQCASLAECSPQHGSREFTYE
jgi:hypothetical protein